MNTYCVTVDSAQHYSFVLQGSGLNNRIIVVIGMLCVLSGGILLTDWQSIPSDPCTKYSPFHHPELRENYTIETMSIPSSMNHAAIQHPETQPNSSEVGHSKIQANVCFPRSYGDTVNFNTSAMKFECMKMDSCVHCIDEDVTTVFPAHSVPCFSLGYRADKLRTIGDSYVPLHEPISTYVCSTAGHCACVITPKDSTASPNDSQSVESLQSAVHIQNLQVIEESVYNVAVNKCESLHGTYGCHWIPHSKITGKLCGDCPPICRSVYHTLTFIQFCIGAILLKISLPTSRVSAVNLLTDVVHKDIQVHACVWEATYIGDRQS